MICPIRTHRTVCERREKSASVVTTAAGRRKKKKVGVLKNLFHKPPTTACVCVRRITQNLFADDPFPIEESGKASLVSRAAALV